MQNHPSGVAVDTDVAIMEKNKSTVATFSFLQLFLSVYILRPPEKKNS